MQLVSQCFLLVHGMLHGAVVRATCLRTALSDQFYFKENSPCNRALRPSRKRRGENHSERYGNVVIYTSLRPVHNSYVNVFAGFVGCSIHFGRYV